MAVDEIIGNGKGRHPAQEAALRRFWEGVPVQDADADLMLFVSEEDAADAVPGDPEKCAVAKACQRMFGSRKVLFWKTCGYVEFPDLESDDPSVKRVYRYAVPTRTRQMIEDLDQRGVRSPGGYLLKAPTMSQRLDYKALRQRGLPRRGVPQVRISGTREDPREVRAVGEIGMTRSGVGMVHFSRKDGA